MFCSERFRSDVFSNRFIFAAVDSVKGSVFAVKMRPNADVTMEVYTDE